MNGLSRVVVAIVMMQIGNSTLPRRISAGSATRPSSSSARAGSCISRSSSTCSRGCGRLGPERCQRSPPHHQGAGDGAETTVSGDRLLHHSDQGCTYASEDYQAILQARGIVCSMRRRGNCYDDAVKESFFSTVKGEPADRFDTYGTRRRSCSTASRCSITSGAGIRRSGRSVPQDSNGARLKPRQSVPVSAGRSG